MITLKLAEYEYGLLEMCVRTTLEKMYKESADAETYWDVEDLLKLIQEDYKKSKAARR